MNIDTIQQTKRVVLLSNDSPSHLPVRVASKKAVAKTDEWITVARKFDTQETQLQLLDELAADGNTDSTKVLLTHLKTKHSGYRSQDVAKGIHDQVNFVTVDYIIHTLIDSKLICYYCNKWTTIFYEYVRDSRQWSLERLSNDIGHNCGNVVIACLECNMRRRTMYHERYLATKQFRVRKIDHSENTSSVKEDK